MKIIFKYILCVLFFLLLSETSKCQSNSSVQIVSSKSYNFDNRYQTPIKKRIERSVRKSMEDYARYASFRNSKLGVDQYSIDQFKSLFANNAKVLADYDQNADLIQSSFYASDVFNKSKSGLNFKLGKGELHKLEYDSEGYYVAKVSITKTMYTQIREGKSKRIKGDVYELVFSFEIPEFELDNSKIIEINGRKVGTQNSTSKLTVSPYLSGQISSSKLILVADNLFSSDTSNANISFGVLVKYPVALDNRLSISLDAFFNRKSQTNFIGTEEGTEVSPKTEELSEFRSNLMINEGSFTAKSTTGIGIFIGPEYDIFTKEKFSLSGSFMLGISLNKFKPESEGMLNVNYSETSFTLIDGPTISPENTHIVEGCECLLDGNKDIHGLNADDVSSSTLSFRFGLNGSYSLTERLGVIGGLRYLLLRGKEIPIEGDSKSLASSLLNKGETIPIQAFIDKLYYGGLDAFIGVLIKL